MTMTRNNVHEPDESDVRHVAGRHLHAAWGHGLGPPRPGQPASLDAVQRAVAAAPAQGFPIDVTFPGENEPDQVDAWISAYAEPFYMRT